MIMTKSKNQHVVKHPKGWAVKGEGNTKIHGQNGRIRAGNSYGNDPWSSKDQK